MPLLGGLLVALFAGLVDFFVVYFTKEVALKLAFAALIVAAFATLYSAMALSIAALSYAMPAGLLTVFQFVFPANVTACAAAAIATDATVSAFQVYVAGVKI